MASTSSPPAQQQALSLASSLGLSLQPEWLEAAARKAGMIGSATQSTTMASSASSSLPHLTAEALFSLVLNADLNCAGAGGPLPADLEVREREKNEQTERRKISFFFFLFLPSVRQTKSKKTQPRTTSTPEKNQNLSPSTAARSPVAGSSRSTRSSTLPPRQSIGERDCERERRKREREKKEKFFSL